MDRKVSLPLLRSLLYFFTCAWEFATTSRVGFLAFEVLLVVVEEEEPWRLVAAVPLPFIPPLLVQFLNILVTRTCQNKSWFGIPFCRSSKSYCLTSDGGKTPPPPPTCVFSGDFVSSRPCLVVGLAAFCTFSLFLSLLVWPPTFVVWGLSLWGY